MSHYDRKGDGVFIMYKQKIDIKSVHMSEYKSFETCEMWDEFKFLDKVRLVGLYFYTHSATN